MTGDEGTRLTADAVIELLGLQPHPTCGFARLTHRVLARDLRGIDALGAGERSLVNVLYFLVTPEAQLRLHRIPAAQMYHHYLGAPLEVLLLYGEGSGEVVTVGSDVAAGMRPQLLVPADTWHVSRLREDDGFALLGTTEWGSFEQAELELGDPAVLARQYPRFAVWLS